MVFSSIFRKIRLLLKGGYKIPLYDIGISAEQIEKALNYKIRNIENFKKAFIHRSFSNSKEELHSNERLEFLGDAILNIVVSDYLFRRFKDDNEGDLTIKRSLIVNKKTLAEKSKELDLGRFLFMSKSEEMDGGRNKESILSNTFEAVIGAIYLDSGFYSAKNFVVENVLNNINEIFSNKKTRNYKGEIIEYFQKNFKGLPDFKLIKEKGPDHDKTYIVEVHFEGRTLGTGEGKSKKEAEQKAALSALDNIDSVNLNFE